MNEWLYWFSGWKEWRMGSYYLPLAAGMGCSYNPYKWMEQMNPEAGMLRIVLGLGTRAVERTPGDYPRLIDLDRARGSLYASAASATSTPSVRWMCLIRKMPRIRQSGWRS